MNNNFTHDDLLATEKIVGDAYIYFTFFIRLYKCKCYIIFPQTRAINTYLHSKQEKFWGNMTYFNQLKDNFLSPNN